jgi:CheY-like chemotaxis protein
MKGDREKGIAAGSSDYISKPVETALLLETIRRWLPASPLARASRNA